MAKKGILARLGFGAKDWEAQNVAPVESIKEGQSTGLGFTSVSTLLGNGPRGARSRQAIYNKWAHMESTPVVAAALEILCTAALGGHETNGDVVFIDPRGNVDKQHEPLLDEIRGRLTPLFNKIAFTVAYAGCTFGDAYARIYWDTTGVVDLHTDEMLRAPLVQAYERGSRTVGVTATIGERSWERLDMTQIARLKMPRRQWIPQYGVVEKALKGKLTENDIDQLPTLPAMVGGSILFNAEPAFDDLMASLLGVVGQRWMDSIDEQIITANMTSMTEADQERFRNNLVRMLEKSKRVAEDAIKRNQPVLERIRHILPVWDDKQTIQVMPANGGQPGRAGNITIEDILLHARLLSGALGVDLTMLGFADQMSGGLGEGGYFRTSAQAAEKARAIRGALIEFFNHIIDIHCLKSRGFVFAPEHRPWELNFYGSISALETEQKQRKLDETNAATMTIDVLSRLKDLGADEAYAEEFLVSQMSMDVERAKALAKIVAVKGGSDEGEPSF